MEEIRKAIQSRHLQIEHNIYNMFKGGIAVPIGTVSMGRKKVAEGRWVEVSQGNTHKQIETLSTNIRREQANIKYLQSSAGPVNPEYYQSVGRGQTETKRKIKRSQDKIDKFRRQIKVLNNQSSTTRAAA